MVWVGSGGGNTNNCFASVVCTIFLLQTKGTSSLLLGLSSPTTSLVVLFFWGGLEPCDSILSTLVLVSCSSYVCLFSLAISNMPRRPCCVGAGLVLPRSLMCLNSLGRGTLTSNPATSLFAIRFSATFNSLCCSSYPVGPTPSRYGKSEACFSTTLLYSVSIIWASSSSSPVNRTKIKVLLSVVNVSTDCFDLAFFFFGATSFLPLGLVGSTLLSSSSFLDFLL